MCAVENHVPDEPESASLVTAPKRNIRVLALSFYPAEGPSVRHRIGVYAKLWEAAGIQLTQQSFMTESLYRRRRRFGFGASLIKALYLIFGALRMMLRLPAIAKFDVVIIHREIFPLGRAHFESRVAKRARCLIYDFDDALWLPMPLAVNQRGKWWDPQRFATMINCATQVVAGNQFLADYARRYNPNVSIIPTPYFDLGQAALRNHSPEVHPIIVWIGNVGNDEYLDLVRRPLQRLARECKFTLRIIGNPEAVALRFDGVEVDGREWQGDQEIAWLLECAIGIMPLFERDYERGKCGFKIIQYFSAGMPAVASPVGINAELIRHGDNGFLAATEDDWYNGLKQLVTDSILRRRMGQAAYATYRKNFAIETCAVAWIKVIEQVHA